MLQQKNIIKKKLKNLKTNNYEFNVYSSKGKEFERNTKINKDGNYSIDINLKQVFYYLVERKLVKNTDIVPGIEVTTEIWDGIGEMKIKKLKYEIEKGEKLIKYVATAKNKKDNLFQNEK